MNVTYHLKVIHFSCHLVDIKQALQGLRQFRFKSASNIPLKIQRFIRMAGKYKIVMVRHGESEWNEKNLFCGWFDANLSEKG